MQSKGILHLLLYEITIKLFIFIINLFSYKKRLTDSIYNIGGDNFPVVLVDFSLKKKITPTSVKEKNPKLTYDDNKFLGRVTYRKFGRK